MDNNKVSLDYSEETITINAEMPSVKKIMEEISTGFAKSENSRWDHLKMYDLNTYPADRRYHLGKLGVPFFVLDGDVLNLTFLRAVGIDEGISLTLRDESKPNHHWVSKVVFQCIKDILKRHYTPTIRYERYKDEDLKEEDEKSLCELSVKTNLWEYGANPSQDRVYKATLNVKPKKPEKKKSKKKSEINWIEIADGTTGTAAGDTQHNNPFTIE